MYRVIIINNGIQTIIHEPTADKNAPHVLSLPFKESLSQAELLSFSMPYGNPGYSLVQGLITKIKMIDSNNGSIIFSGRALTTKDGMSSDGKFLNNVECEGAMNYLNDSQTRRWNFTNQTPRQIFQFLLDRHNEKMDNDRKIYIGNIEITQPITIDTNCETTLFVIISKIRNILGGDLRVQERNGALYLDYLVQIGANNEVPLRVGANLKQIIRECNPLDLITRVIPMGYGEGVNQLDITKVNGGVEYIEDSAAIFKYGIIEGLATNKDIQNADTLKIYGQTVLNEKKQPAVTLDTSMIDRSLLAQYQIEKYSLGDTLHTLVDIMNLDVYSRVIERERDLVKSPWDPKLVISTRPITLTDQIIDLKKRNLTLENAPQGNTCIFALSKAENADAEHPITFDLDIPKETINVNRVYLNLHGRKYRANSKGTAAGGGSVTTTAGGGGTSSTTASGGGVSTTSASGGGYSSTIASTPASDYNPDTADITTNDASPTDPHHHFLPNGLLAMVYNHTHKIAVNISSHIHSLTISAHTHVVTLLDHVHSITLLNHIHDAIYGIFESTYPKNIRVKVNNQDINISYGDGDSSFDEYDIDITPYVSIESNKIEITTEQNGRIEAIIYSQIFIQSK